MPYHDPRRPFVRYWFAATQGDDVHGFADRLSEANQDELEARGGACVMFAHFGHGFVDGGRVSPRVRRLLERLAAKDGWFVPVSALLDHVRAWRGEVALTDAQRARLERRWLAQKIRHGAA